jgi:hypothetical protein
MIDLETTVEELKKYRLVDRGILKPGGKKELLDAMDRLSKRNLNSWVLLLSCGEPIDPWKQLWDRMNPESAKDLLLIFNCNQWIARGWNLQSSEISSILSSAEPDLRVYYGRGLATALNRLAAKAQPKNEKEIESEESSWFIPTAGGLLILGAGVAVAAVIRRRINRTAETERNYAASLGSAKKALADVVLAAADLPTEDPDARDLQLKAMDVSERIQSLDGECEKNPELKGKAMTKGTLLQLENELQTLMSTILQKAASIKRKGEAYVEREN